MQKLLHIMLPLYIIAHVALFTPFLLAMACLASVSRRVLRDDQQRQLMPRQCFGSE